MYLQKPLTQGSRIFKNYADRLANLGIFTFQDFLFHLPSRYEDFSTISTIGSIQEGETVTIQGTVMDIKNQYLRGGRIKTMQKATVMGETGMIELTWFNQPFLTRAITPNGIISASGRVQKYGRSLKISSPQFEMVHENKPSIHTGRLIPVYPETKGVSSKWLRRQIDSIIKDYLDELEEYLPDVMIKKNNFMNLKDAIHEVHFPQSIETAEKARKRLAFDELFLMQMAAAQRRMDWKREQNGQAFDISSNRKKIEKCIESLPFKLTDAQQHAINAILEDFTKNKPMNRLLQGDVGSGKTIVGAITMYAAHLSGYQSVLMAPTEILAQQHHKSISKLLEPLGVRVGLVTGSKKLNLNPVIPAQAGIQKKTTGSRIKSGMTKKEEDDKNVQHDILIGTHAVLNDKITFNKLAYIIIDEQQRFGVEQRGKIRQKGDNPHLLTMTATPIPRTVALTMYGDLDLSYLNEMPHGRKKIKTWLVPPEKRDAAYDWIRKQILNESSDKNNSSLSDSPAGEESKGGRSQAFIICPFIEESESMNTIKAAAKEYERLSREVYTDLKLGLLHGKQKGKEKDEILEQFKKKEFDILVATPVVEVGIDIPNATIIMIEASERFGLAQLHQLRGRVGRGDKQSYCLLFTDNKEAMTSRRLKGMETLYSGAELAELDLKLRGPGNLYGTAQHGIPKLKVATFSDTELIQHARYAADEVFEDLDKYPLLKAKVHEVTLQYVSPD